MNGDDEFREFVLKVQRDFDREVLDKWKPISEFRMALYKQEQGGCWVCGHLESSGLNLGTLNGEEVWVCDGCGVRMGILEPL